MSEFDKMLNQQQELMNKMNASDAASSGEIELTKVLTFYIDSKVYGLEIEDVREILGVPHITKVPGVPDYIKGITILPIMCLGVSARRKSLTAS